MPCSVKTLAGWVPRYFTTSSSNGVLLMYSPKFGSEVWNTTNYMGSLGLGKRQLVLASKQRWPESPTVQTRRIGKKGRKNDIFLSKKLASSSRYYPAQQTGMTSWLWSLYSKQTSFHRRQQRSGTYAWMHAMLTKRKTDSAMASSHTFAHEGKRQERETNPNLMVRSWIVELTHSCFNHLRNLLPCIKTDRSYQALTN